MAEINLFDASLRTFIRKFKEGDEDAVDIFIDLLDQCPTTVFRYITKKEAEHYYNDGQFDISFNKYWDYLKNHYEFLDVESELRNAMETLETKEA